MGTPRWVRYLKSDGTGVPIALGVLNWLILLAVVSLSIWLVRPPEPVPATAPADVFSAERAKRHVRMIARVPHPVGTSANQEVRNYLVNQLSSLGLQAQVQSGIGFSKFLDWLGGINAGYVHNVIGKLPGIASTRAVLMVAHYDSHEQGPGAADDGAGVAAILEAVRAVKAQSPLRNDIIALFTDGEESGCLGADLFASSHPWVKDIGVALNFDTAGDAGPSIMLETSTGNRWLVEQFAAAAPYPFASSLFYSAGRRMKGDSPTDLPDLMRAGLAGLNFGILGNKGHVNHTRLDNVDNLNFASLQHQGSYALALTRLFGNLDLSRAKLHDSEDDVFFDWIGTRLVFYRESWVLPMHIILSMVLAWLLITAVRRQTVRAREALKAVLAFFAAIVAIPALLVGARWLFDRVFGSRLLLGDTASNWLVLTAFIVLGLGCSVWALGYSCSKFGLLNLCAAGLSMSWILTTALVLGMPAGSYLLFWPLVFATASFAWLSANAGSTLAPLLAAVPGLLLFTPFVYLLGVLNFVEGAGPAPLVVAGFMVALLSFLLAPFVNGLAPGRSATRIVPASLLTAAIVLGAWGVFLSRFSPEHPQPDTILYSLNADNHHAMWITYDGSVDAWTQQFLTEHPRRGNMPEYHAVSPNDLWNSAPAIDLPGPEVDMLDSSVENQVHSLHLRVRSPRHANSILLNFGSSTEFLAATIAGRDPFQDALRGESGVPREVGTIQFVAMPDDGVEVTLKLKCVGQCDIRASDRSFGLPSLPGLSFSPRPLDKMGWYGTDTTLVGREYKF